MQLEHLLTLKLSGILLIASTTVPLLLIIIISKGDLNGFQASIKGIQGVGESARILSKVGPLGPLTFTITASAYGLLTYFLQKGGDQGIGLLALVLILSSHLFILFQGSFHGSVTVWASSELAKTGSVPELFYPLWRWMYGPVQQIYVNLSLISLAIYGWAILVSGLMPEWLGWGLIGFSAIWLTLFLILGDNLPLVLVIPPIVIGVVAIINGGNPITT